MPNLGCPLLRPASWNNLIASVQHDPMLTLKMLQEVMEWVANGDISTLTERWTTFGEGRASEHFILPPLVNRSAGTGNDVRDWMLTTMLKNPDMDVYMAFGDNGMEQVVIENKIAEPRLFKRWVTRPDWSHVGAHVMDSVLFANWE